MSEPVFAKSGNDFPTNPYIVNPPLDAYGHSAAERTELQLATVLQRFIGFVLDTLLGMVCMLPGLILTIVGAIAMGMEADRNNGQITSVPATLITGIILVIAGVFVPIVIQIALLATRSQSFGKYCLNLQIVDFESGKPAGFVQTFLVRYFCVWLIKTIPFLGFVFWIVDSCFVLREDRRCIHDLLASTTVIDRSGGTLV